MRNIVHNNNVLQFIYPWDARNFFQQESPRLHDYDL